MLSGVCLQVQKKAFRIGDAWAAEVVVHSKDMEEKLRRGMNGDMWETP